MFAVSSRKIQSDRGAMVLSVAPRGPQLVMAPAGCCVLLVSRCRITKRVFPECHTCLRSTRRSVKGPPATACRQCPVGMPGLESGEGVCQHTSCAMAMPRRARYVTSRWPFSGSHPRKCLNGSCYRSSMPGSVQQSRRRLQVRALVSGTICAV